MAGERKLSRLRKRKAAPRTPPSGDGKDKKRKTKKNNYVHVSPNTNAGTCISTHIRDRLLRSLGSSALGAQVVVETSRMISISCPKITIDNNRASDDDSEKGKRSAWSNEARTKFIEVVDLHIGRMSKSGKLLSNSLNDEVLNALSNILEIAVERSVRFISSKANSRRLRYFSNYNNDIQKLAQEENRLEFEVKRANAVTMYSVKEIVEMLVASLMHSSHVQKIGIANQLPSSLPQILVGANMPRYEVYGLAHPMKSVAGMMGLNALRSRIESEFHSIYCGGKMVEKNCRVYATLRNFAISRSNRQQSGFVVVLQINIGKNLRQSIFAEMPTNTKRSQRKSKKVSWPICSEHKFTAFIKPETNVLALSCQTSTSKTAITRYIIAAISGSICTVDCSSDIPNLGDDQRIGELEDNDPITLLDTILSCDDRAAVGRFAVAVESAGSKESAHVLGEFNDMLIGNSLDQIAEKRRLDIAKKQGQKIARLQMNVERTSGGTASVLATGRTGIIVDHDVASSRKLRLERQKELGLDHSCTKRTEFRWKWEGHTNALCTKDTRESNLKPIRFKCGVVFKGKNVFAGLQTLMDLGIAKFPLPDFLRDAPMNKGDIYVNRLEVPSMAVPYATQLDEN